MEKISKPRAHLNTIIGQLVPEKMKYMPIVETAKFIEQYMKSK